MQGIAYWIDKRACITPERVALTGETRTLTYKEMAEEVNRLARTLALDYAVRQGDRIAILARNRIEYFTLFFAIAKIGAIAVPLNNRLTAPELEFQLRDSPPKMLIADREFYDLGRQIAESVSVPFLVPMDPQESQPSIFDRMLEHPGTAYEVPEVNGSLPFLIIYTSGTTGRPKGAVLTQENMFWNAVNNNLALDITSADKILTILPLFHIGGIGLFAMPGLLAGAEVIVPSRFVPEQTLQLIEQKGVTICMGVPTIFDALRKSPAFDTTDLSSLRWFYSGGAPCPHELIRFYHERGLPLGQGFGMSETSPTVFMLSKEDYRERVGSIGKPVMFCDVRIVDEEGRDVPRGEVGELWVKGPNVFKEYWNLPEETAKSQADGWFRTGDLAKMDEDGFVYIAGRKKEMIISGGENVYPLEVEQALYAHPSVAEAAVWGIPDEKWGEVPVAAVAFRPGMSASEEELAAHCLSRLAKYKVPKRFIIMESLPKNATGKIDKVTLKKNSMCVN